MNAVFLIAQQVLRVSFVGALILGLVFWTLRADSLLGLHMLFGILVVACLWTLGAVTIASGGGLPLSLGAIGLGLLVLLLGLTQTSLRPGPGHFPIQVLHLLLGVTAIGFGEMLGARRRRSRNGQAPPRSSPKTGRAVPERPSPLCPDGRFAAGFQRTVRAPFMPRLSWPGSWH
ncbi:MAG: hypothetical protein JF888_10495 [Candidatus Dormibacteraeota bacterium]|uniref:Uncharacterized protein n=1 Tax=Candidatus Dormiibacter inghamiae TaxID=3127013 RepID=A0A934KHF2_9BACT|nr:hypothetical protein [Candidatus Dormibacteraeota bacterium]MBJ7607376.1 hypothetical protein [Candidatus Dormibacteraeota bacterium]